MTVHAELVARRGERLGPLPRAIAVLRALAMGARRGVPLTHLAQQTEMTHSTVHRLLRQMLQERLVQQDPETRRYKLGPLAFELGLAAQQQFNLRGLCWNTVKQLALDTEDTVYLVQRSDHEAVCIDRQEGPSPIRVLTLDVGSRRPLGLGAGGLAILAATAEDERECLIATIKPSIQSQWCLSEVALECSIEQTRKNGFAVVRNQITAGTTAVGQHILDKTGRPIAALSVAAVNGRMGAVRIGHIQRLLADATRNLERLLAANAVRCGDLR